MPATSVIRNGSSRSSSSVDRRARGQRMVGRDRDPQLVVGDRQVLDARRAARAASSGDCTSSADVDPAGQQRVQRRLVLEHLQRQLRVRPARAQLARGARQQPGGGRRERRHPHLRPPDAAPPRGRPPRPARGVEQRGRRGAPAPRRPAVSVTPRALRSSTRMPSAASSRLMCWRDGGLREVQRGGRVAERAAHRDLAERGEELEVEHHGTIMPDASNHHWT